MAPDFTNSLVGGVGWDFLGDSEGYYFATPANFTFPDEFTLEFWAYPRSQRGHLVSFASEDDSNCLLVVNTKFPAYNEWYHIAITYADDTTTLYLNGDAQTGWVWADGFCGDYEGHLVLGQEQDSFLGTFDANQAFDGIIDTVAVYSTAWETVPADKPVGVDLNNMTLYALYSGYTRARDLVRIFAWGCCSLGRCANEVRARLSPFSRCVSAFVCVLLRALLRATGREQRRHSTLVQVRGRYAERQGQSEHT